MRFGVLGALALFSGSFLACNSPDPVIVGPTVTTVLDEKFTGADGSSLNGWNVVAMGGATFDLSGNRAHPAQGGGGSPFALYPVSLDKIGYTTTVDLIVSGGAYSGDAYIVAKSQSATSLDDAYVCGINGSTGQLMLAVNQGGVPTQLASSAVFGALADGTTAQLSFDVQSFISVSMICKLTLNGTEYTATAADITHPNAGYWGLFGGDSGANFLYFDNFKIVN